MECDDHGMGTYKVCLNHHLCFSNLIISQTGPQASLTVENLAVFAFVPYPEGAQVD